jgi:hypothetical protein
VKLRAVVRKIEFGDPLLLLYALVFVRQCTWNVPNQFAAWTSASVIALSAWALYVYYKPEPADRIPGSFWAIVVLPLLIVYLLRTALPDLSFDVLNHRLIQSERALRGPQFLPGDFFPNVFPFNPSSDMVTGIYRHALGYRLGTIVNLLALVWTGTKDGVMSVYSAVSEDRASVVIDCNSSLTAETIWSLMVSARVWLTCWAVRHHNKCTPTALTTIDVRTRAEMALRMPMRIGGPLRACYRNTGPY